MKIWLRGHCYLSAQRADSNGQRNRGGKFIQTKLSLLTAIDPSTVRLRVRSTLDLNPLPLSTAQRDYFERFGARPRQLFKWVSRQPLRPHILSFIWRLLHHRLYTHLLTQCPFCKKPYPNTEHIFNTCTTATLPNTQPPLSTFLQHPYSSTTLEAVLYCWAIWKTMWNLVHHGPRPNDVIWKTMKWTIDEEIHRMKLAHPVIRSRPLLSS